MSDRAAAAAHEENVMQTATRSEVAALIDEAAALESPHPNSNRSLQMAREALGRHDAAPRHWTSEHFAIALRDAANSARLAVRYHGQSL
jgi:hypothetical protein